MSSKQRVVVIGDIILDHYIIGGVERISPEAPVPVISHMSEVFTAGGAANVAVNIASLGCEVELIGLVGDDSAAGELGVILQRWRISQDSLVIDRERPTTRKTRVVSGRQQIVRIDCERCSKPDAATTEALIRSAEAAIDRCEILVMSDYAKGVLDDSVVAPVIAAAKRRERKILVDPKRTSFAGYKGADIIKPNRSELELVVGHLCRTDADVEQAGKFVSEQLGGAVVLVTRAEAGMSLLQHDSSPVHIPSSFLEVADVSGAGDTALAALAVGLAEGQSVLAATFSANLAAGIVVGKSGTAIVSRRELEVAQARASTPVLHAGILVDRAQAVEVVGNWRRAGNRVVFTNGCFDLLHSGHIRLLTGAAQEGDRLVVALNADSSVKRLKGSTRPIQNELHRAEIIGALRVVDLVVLFDEDTPLELISMIMPDVIVKGADYSEDQVVGGDVVRKFGGRVALIPLVEGQSTTKLLERDADRAAQ